MSTPLRIGVIGAGANTRLRHIPELRRLAGVEIHGVANSSDESSRVAASELNIPVAYPDWRQLIADPKIDAVVIGTWPNLHCEVTCAALQAGKHVLCEARMARSLDEARRMLATAQSHPQLVAQLVPSPHGLVCGPAVAHLVKGHYLGDLREVIVLGANNQFWDYSQPLHWRQDAEISGRNILSLGILQETLDRWLPPVTQLFAQTEIFEPTRPLPSVNRYADATVPDSVQIVGELQGGARVMYHISGVLLFGPGLQIHLYGSRGTIKIEFVNGEERVLAGRAEDTALSVLEIPADQRGEWSVERDFVAAIRREKKVELTTFAAGVRYMEFLEAVARSAEHNAPVALPLDETA